MIRALAVALLVGVSVVSVVWTVATLSDVALAQAPATPPVRTRGTLEQLDGQKLTVKTYDGQSIAINLAENFMVVGISKASVDDIQAGKFIGTTTLGEREGKLVALEVHIFPEAMRGTGEGHYDWDLRPSSKMTNANVATVTTFGKDHVLEVQYKGGEQKVLVPENASVVSFVPGDKSLLKPGAPVFVISQRQPDGSLKAARVNVGVNGQIPPM
jgi:hypothetical protein